MMLENYNETEDRFIVKITFRNGRKFWLSSRDTKRNAGIVATWVGFAFSWKGRKAAEKAATKMTDRFGCQADVLIRAGTGSQ